MNREIEHVEAERAAEPRVALPVSGVPGEAGVKRAQLIRFWPAVVADVDQLKMTDAAEVEGGGGDAEQRGDRREDGEETTPHVRDWTNQIKGSFGRGHAVRSSLAAEVARPPAGAVGYR